MTIECFHSLGQLLWKFIGTKERVCIRKKFNSHRIGLGHQHGRHCFGTPIWPPWHHVKTLYYIREIFLSVRVFLLSRMSPNIHYFCSWESLTVRTSVLFVSAPCLILRFHPHPRSFFYLMTALRFNVILRCKFFFFLTPLLYITMLIDKENIMFTKDNIMLANIDFIFSTFFIFKHLLTFFVFQA